MLIFILCFAGNVDRRADPFRKYSIIAEGNTNQKPQSNATIVQYWNVLIFIVQIFEAYENVCPKANFGDSVFNRSKSEVILNMKQVTLQSLQGPQSWRIQLLLGAVHSFQ